MEISRLPCKPLLDNLYEGIYIIDTNQRIIYGNASAAQITGFTFKLADADCKNILAHIDEQGNNLCEIHCPVALTLKDGLLREQEVFFKHVQGHRIPVSVRIIPIRDKAGVITGVVEAFVDNSPRAALHMELEQLKDKANIDRLTALITRSYGEVVVNAKVAEYKDTNQPVGILFADIDNFKNVNDVYGHEVGDLVLKMVAKTLTDNVRTDDYVIRWGGEEIVIILSGYFNSDMLPHIADKLRVLVQQSIVRAIQHVISVTISIGATLINEGDTGESVIKRADDLMYQSKKAGRNRVTIG